MAKITLQPGKTYTYAGNLNKYTVVVGEIIDGGIVTPGSELPTLRYGSGPPPSGLGRVGDVYIDTANSILYTRGSSGWDAGVAFRGADGADGNPGIAGVDGQSPLSGYLTSDSHIVTGDNFGNVTDDLTDVDTQFVVFRGDTQVTGLIYKASSDGTSFTGATATHPSGVSATISSTGAISFSKTGWGLATSYDTVTMYFRAQIGSVSLVKSFKLTRTKGGKDAKSIRLSASRNSFTKNAAGEFDPDGQSIKFAASMQNYEAGSKPAWKLEVEDPDAVSGWSEVVGGLVLSTSDFEAELRQSAFTSALNTITPAGTAKVVRVTATAPVADINLDGENDAALSDTISVSAVSDGQDGADGISPINAVLTNETHAVVANELGEVTDVMEGAGGYFQVYFGGDAITNAQFSIMNGETPINAVDGSPATLTKNGVKLTLESNGRYTAEEDGPGWVESGPDVITFTLRASEVYDLYIDKVFTLNRVKGGANAKFIYLTTDRQSFKNDSSGNPSPTEQTLTLNAQRQNIDSSVTWSFEVLYNGTWVQKTSLVAGTDYGTPSTVGNVDTTTITYAQYSDILNVGLGSGDVLKVKASSGDFYDEVSIITVADGEKGEQGNEGRKIVSTDEIALGSEPDPNEDYGTVVGDLLMDTVNHKIYLRATATTWTLQGASFKGIDGVGGAALSAVLSNETHTVPSDNDGYVQDEELDGAGGQMYVYYGPILASSANYAEVEYFVSGDGGSTWSPANTPVTISGLEFVIGLNGLYNVSSVSFDADTGVSSWTHTVNTITAKFKAEVTSTEDKSPLATPTPGTDIIVTEVFKDYTITKAAGGADAKIVTLVSDGLTFTKGPSGTYFPSVQSIDFTALRKNLTDVTLVWKAYRLGTTDWELAWSSASPGATPLLTITGDIANMDLEQFDEIIGTSTNATVKVRVEADASTYDEQSVVVIADGVSPLSGLLTNETHTAIADSNGNVLDMNDPGGDFKVYEGSTEITSGINFFVIDAEGDPVNSYTNADGLTAAIDSTTGVYTITATGGSWDGDTKLASSFRFRAVRDGTSVDKIYSIGKALGGENAQYVRLTCDRNGFLFNADGSKPDSAAVASFIAETKNYYPTTTYPVTWEVYVGTTKKTPLADFLTVDPTDDRKASMTIDQFVSALGGSPELRVRAFIDDSDNTNGADDSVTILKTTNGADGTTPINGYLTNESVTIVAESNGSLLPDKFVDGATSGQILDTDGTFSVSIGTLPLTTGLDYWIETGVSDNPSGSAVGDFRIWTPTNGPTLKLHTGTGAYFLTASSPSSWSSEGQNFTLAVTSSNPLWGTSGPFKKVFSVAKSKGGASAKLVTVTSDAANFTKDTNGNFNTATITFTAALRNIAATPDWTVRKVSGGTVDMSTAGLVDSSKYTTGGSGGTYTLSMTSANFSTLGVNNLYVKAEADGLSDSWTIGVTSDGAGGVSGLLTNEVHSISVGDNGNYDSGSLSSAGGTFKIFKGSTEQTATGNYLYGIVGAGVAYNSAAQKYSIVTNNLTMSIHRTNGVYELSSAAGDGASKWNADQTTFELFSSASSGGGEVRKTYTISKNANKFISITSPGIVQLSADGTSAVGASAISSTATLTNCSGTNANWSLEKRDNSSSAWTTVTSPSWTISGNTMTMTFSQFVTNRGGSAKPDATLRVTARADFGISDSQEIVSVRQGSKGDTGSNGTNGTNGTSAKAVILSSDKTAFTVSPNSASTYRPTSQTATIRANLQNCTGSNPNWSVSKVTNSGTATSLTGSLSDYITGTGTSVTMSQAQFNKALGAHDFIRVSANADGLTDYVSLFKMSDGSGGIVVYKTRLYGYHYVSENNSSSYLTVGNPGSPYGVRVYRTAPDVDLDSIITTSETLQSSVATPINYYTKFTANEAGTYEVTLGATVNWDGSESTSTYYPAQFKVRSKLWKPPAIMGGSSTLLSDFTSLFTVEDANVDNGFAMHVHTVALGEGDTFYININRSKSIALAANQPLLRVYLSDTDSYVSIKKV